MRTPELVLVPALVGLPAAQAQAQGSPYPDRPVRLIVTFGPGGLADVVAQPASADAETNSAAVAARRMGMPVIATAPSTS